MTDYIRPITTVDPVIFTLKDNQLHILLIHRNKEPFTGWLSLPGGWVYADQDINLDASIERVLKDKTGVVGAYFEQLHTFGSMERDPRQWSISISYVSLMPWHKVEMAIAGEGVQDVEWVPVNDIDYSKLAFDHADINKMALERLRNKVNYSTLPVYLLPEKFTKTELQKVYEMVLGSQLDKSAFRKKLNEFDFLESTGEMSEGVKHRPALLYKVKDDYLLTCFRSNLKN